jgi:hypothetical protein
MKVSNRSIEETTGILLLFLIGFKRAAILKKPISAQDEVLVICRRTFKSYP